LCSEKSLIHPGRTLRSKSGGVNLAIHVSAPRELQPPLRTMLEEARQTLFHPSAGHAVKYGQQPGRAAAGPTACLVLSKSGHPSRRWRDNSRESGVSADVVSCKADFFDPKGKVDNGLSYFKGMCFCNQNPFGIECSSKFLCFLCAARGHALPFGRFRPSFGASLEFLKSFPSKAFLLIRKRLLVLDRHCFDILFVGVRTMICYYGPTVPPHFTNWGGQSSSYGIFEQIIMTRPSKLRISIL
jgi:hypothetical protein